MRDDHRPWPVPASPWFMKQVWHDLLFAHWPVEADVLKPLIPEPLTLDTYQDQAWIGVIPFSVSGMRLRYMPPIPFISRFAEINVRTYVTIDDKPGIFLFSLDATKYAAVIAARWFYHLPYYYADITIRKDKSNIHFHSRRKQSFRTVEFAGAYKPSTSPYQAVRGSLDYWLTERYCLYTQHNHKLYRCDILHEPWNLQLAEGVVMNNTMFEADGRRIFDQHKPVLHYAEKQEVLLWGLTEVR